MFENDGDQDSQGDGPKGSPSDFLYLGFLPHPIRSISPPSNRKPFGWNQQSPNFGAPRWANPKRRQRMPNLFLAGGDWNMNFIFPSILWWTNIAMENGHL